MVKRGIYNLLLVCSLALASNVTAQDSRRDVCAKEIENRVDRCVGGKEYVWHYTFSGPGDGGRISRSWGYKTREAAQRALDSDKRLCQMVDRYWEKTDCRTTYGSIFCAGCAAQSSYPSRPGIEEAEALAAGIRQIDRWRSEMTTALKNIRAAQTTGQANPSAGVGNALREYIGELRAARQRVLSVEKLMSSVARGGTNVLNRLSEAVKELDDITGRVEISRARLSDKLSEMTTKPPVEPYAVRENGGKATLAGKWSLHTFDFHGTRLQQSVTIEANRLKVTIQAVNPEPNAYNLRTYTVFLSDLFPEKQTVERAGPLLWAVTIFANGRTVTDISSSSNDSITEHVSRIKLFFSAEDSARDAANALRLLSSNRPKNQ